MSPQSPRNQGGSVRKRPAQRKAAKSKQPQNFIARLVSACKRLGKEIAKAHAQLRDFQQKDHPAWQQWIKETFADELRKITELEEEHDRIVMRLNKVNDLVYFGECSSRREAYQEVLHREREGSLEDDPGQGVEPESGMNEPISFNDLEDDPMADVMVETMLNLFLEETRGIDSESLSEEEFRKAKAQFLESMKHAESGNHARFEKALLQVGADDSQENRKSVKQLYRRLAKRLHPDQNGKAGELEKKFWDEAQLAYQAMDASALEAIELRYRIESGEPMGKEETPAMNQLERDLAAERSLLREQLRDLKHEPAWNFTRLSPVKLKELKKATKVNLNEEKCDLRMEVENLKRAEALLAKSPRRKKPAAKKKPRPHKEEPPRNTDWKQMEIPF